MNTEDEILREIWEIKDSLAAEAEGNLQKLLQILQKEAAAAEENQQFDLLGLTQKSADFTFHALDELEQRDQK